METFDVVVPAEPVVAVAGKDVVLPCYLKPNISAESFEVRWFRKDFGDYVHLYNNYKTFNENQKPSYRGRTALFPEELKKGNVSLKLSAVRGSDGGRYTCFVQFQDRYDDLPVEVIVKGTHPLVSIEGYKEGGIGLMCESTDWFPEPEVVWLDSEGDSLTVKPAETHRSESGSVTLRQHVIVQEAGSNRFTCQVHQQQPTVVRETSIEIPDEIFQRTLPWKAAFAVFFLVCISAAVAIAVLTQRCLKLRRTKDELDKEFAELQAKLEGLKTQLVFFVDSEIQQRKAEFESNQKHTDQDYSLCEFESSQSYAVDVTLDPDTAHPKLILSEDGKQVRDGDTEEALPDNQKRFTLQQSVLGRDWFNSGKHYWEVRVSEIGWWILGVASESVDRREDATISPGQGYWSIELRQWSGYMALTQSRVFLHLSRKPQKVGVYVDYEGGQVSFYNVETKSHIYTYSGQKFTGRLYPLFSSYSSAHLMISSVVTQTNGGFPLV